MRVKQLLSTAWILIFSLSRQSVILKVNALCDSCFDFIKEIIELGWLMTKSLKPQGMLDGKCGESFVSWEPSY